MKFPSQTAYCPPFRKREAGAEGETEKTPDSGLKPEPIRNVSPKSKLSDCSSLQVSRDQLYAAQRTDLTLDRCFKDVVRARKATDVKVVYKLDGGILLSKWSTSPSDSGYDWHALHQVVVPSVYRSYVLSVAHGSGWSGHLDMTKTFWLILKRLFWPGLNAEVSKHCRSCYVC